MGTEHISFKRNEGEIKRRGKVLAKKLHKNKSDMYKFAMNKLYLELHLKEEESNGKKIIYC